MQAIFADKASIIYSTEPEVQLTADSIIETTEQVTALSLKKQTSFGINDLWKIRQGRPYANGYLRRS
ncbi:MAG: hypothetical protein KAX45_10750 [Chitinophagaceae bacterium]|nr:hypothetical protein [Chitinophagaceae bacterium]MBP8245010.1 hypothetical protein [Chitinophagaceae bacterium]